MIILTGRIAKEPTILSNGGIKLRIVTNDRVKNNATGQFEDARTSWWNVKLWNHTAEQSKNVLKKGQEVTVVGTIYEENWVDPNTQSERTSYDIKADSIAVTTYALNKTSQSTGWDLNQEVPF